MNDLQKISIEVQNYRPIWWMKLMQRQSIYGQRVWILHSTGEFRWPNIALWPACTSSNVAVWWKLKDVTSFRIVFLLMLRSIGMDSKELKRSVAFERLEFIFKDKIVSMFFTWFRHGKVPVIYIFSEYSSENEGIDSDKSDIRCQWVEAWINDSQVR